MVVGTIEKHALVGLFRQSGEGTDKNKCESESPLDLSFPSYESICLYKTANCKLMIGEVMSFGVQIHVTLA